MSSVSELYGQHVAAGRIRADAAQQSILPILDRVRADIATLPPPPAPAKARSGWRSVFGSGGQAPAKSPSVRGLYLWGGVGRGKSMLMDILAESTSEILPTRRVHFHQFMQEIHAGLDAARRRGDQDAVRPVANEVAQKVRVLCFDEMQITDIADAMIVGRLFQVLFEQGVTVITTSNRAPEELYKNGLNRQLFLPFIAMIGQNMEVVCLDSQTDHRQGRSLGGQVWFTPADGAAHGELDAIWNDLTGGAVPQPGRIEVKGRSFAIDALNGRVGRSGFWELCGQPLGAADYLELARRVDALLIDGVPRLGLSNYNEAKRFVTLIDALYEAKVRLIASGADEPEQLYNEGEGSFEFERTASRLREMQDVNWGQPA